MKKLTIALIVATVAPAPGFAQPAGSTLEKFAEQMQSLKTVAIDFEYQHAHAAETAGMPQRGRLLIMDRMYRLDWGESTIYCNGQLRWTHLKSVDEVTVSTPSLLEDGVFSDPSMLFSFDPKDYRTRQRDDRTSAEGKVVVAIDLTPKDKKAAYTAINLQLDKVTLLPVSIIYHAKDGGSVTVKVKKVDRTVKPTAADFTFDPKKYPDVEVVDMR